MTTLLLSENFPPKVGGTSRWFWEIYRRLPRRDFFIAAGEDPDQDSVDRTTDLRIRRVPLTFANRYLRPTTFGSYWRAYRLVRKLVAEEKIHRIHAARCVHEGLLALFVKRLAGIPYDCYAHGEEVNLSNRELRPAFHERRVYDSREMALLVGAVLRNASHVVANSRNTQSVLVDRWRLAAERVHLLHPGVDTDYFRPAARNEAGRQELGWVGRTVLLTVGRLQRRKGHDVLIAALPEIRDAIPDLLYAIVGEGEESARLRSLVAELGVEPNVQFLGGIDDQRLMRCYQQCDLFVLPNREIKGDIEGFGMVLLEAQACGRPVVAGASGGTAETMQIPTTGMVVACETPATVADQLVKLLRDKRRLDEMGRAARRWVVERFDWKSLATQAGDLFAGFD